MSQTLTLELSDETYSLIRRQAETAGATPAVWAATALERQYSRRPGLARAFDPRTEEELRVARERFEQLLGKGLFGPRTDVSNESIDADLAREYASMHEDE